MICIGQTEVIEFLKSCDKPVTRQQIAEGIECNPIIVSHALKKLLKFKDVEFIEYKREEACELVSYTLLRRTRFFFIPEEKERKG